MVIRLQISGFSVNIDSDNGRVKVFIDPLTVIQGIVLIPFVADAYIEVTILTKVHIAAIVVTGLILLTNKDRFSETVRCIRVRTFRLNDKPGNKLMTTAVIWRSIKQEERFIRAEIGMKSNAQ